MKERDRIILEALETGNNQKCLSFLYKYSLPKICDYVKKNNGSLEDAKDIFQDAVLIFYKHVKGGKFNREYDIDSFLYTVSRNLWINYSKRKKLIVSTDTVPDFVEEADLSFLKRLRDKNRKEALEELLDSIGEKCKQLLTLFVYEGRKLREITEIMGLENEVAAKSTVYRCRQKLMKQVKDSPRLIEKLEY